MGAPPASHAAGMRCLVCERIQPGPTRVSGVLTIERLSRQAGCCDPPEGCSDGPPLLFCLPQLQGPHGQVYTFVRINEKRRQRGIVST